ncbi:hypothetical protein SERLADRAFT_411077 [Serpula lacrymans var. lacrymans S7.9]|uniref:Uncharacterized protein n=1 Tax=Serpula lacrymans var. lacrymans (strain S7.9) TaxID=578457 RepID=F8P8X6_SERL9|nr:uncharacterized protein SERLADRAFT_411077 [Serpula lacrymans var. lacrymans S7.9]EGO20105.1 hypothetical protein SERLADRAFT_411077 [Serpula lacrymans var. lacrymans S7.9]
MRLLTYTTTTLLISDEILKESYMRLPDLKYSKGTSKKTHDSYKTLLRKYEKTKNKLVLITGKYTNLQINKEKDWRVFFDAKKNTSDIIKAARPKGPSCCANDNWKISKIACESYWVWKCYHIDGKNEKEVKSKESSKTLLGKCKESKTEGHKDASIKKARLETGNLSDLDLIDLHTDIVGCSADSSKVAKLHATSKDTTTNNVLDNAKAPCLKIRYKKPIASTISATHPVPPIPSSSATLYIASAENCALQVGTSDIISAALLLTSAVEKTKKVKEGAKKISSSKDYLKVTVAITPSTLVNLKLLLGFAQFPIIIAGTSQHLWAIPALMGYPSQHFWDIPANLKVYHVQQNLITTTKISALKLQKVCVTTWYITLHLDHPILPLGQTLDCNNQGKRGLHMGCHMLEQPVNNPALVVVIN